MISWAFIADNKADAFDLTPITNTEISHHIISTDSDSRFSFTPNSEVILLDETLIDSAKKRYSQEEQVDHLFSYLNRQNPRVFSKEIVRIIVSESNRFGADYRLVAAIMGKESGFCNANYKLYNCFGYLNGVQYGSYEEAFKVLTPRIASIVARHGWNTMGIANEYKPVDRQGWSTKVHAIASKI